MRDNIAAFGGDQNNVTIAGTSVGADSVGLHLVSPGSEGLFHRAIIESGTPTLQWPTHAESIAQEMRSPPRLVGSIRLPCWPVFEARPSPRSSRRLPLASQAVLEPPSGRVFWLPVVDGLELPD